ncbi:hypothetical protein PGTUg99_002635 [Puccinia graminis f. sp. tritici]|uniref:Uncharacterized protein n=1 Tax=Puccinia graminis f. sp. tritici TaxID=56615 RepID=A0A5B0M000_PUCGR|nr:hypothetical protein PGTUg99_002473 [Puccinia graminis f. sp. tritici]KAA1122567.1 hypothetical protein PGTUg99_001430 [Puccinia graminis f. sp. tritici]KAA1129833.1 hypothetical protein PGTUg99_002635 [Puccinia graminis f. sp. tritici]
MPGPTHAKWGNGSHYCVITLTAPSTPPPAGSSSSPATPKELETLDPKVDVRTRTMWTNDKS